jgi:hypothetical protein
VEFVLVFLELILMRLFLVNFVSVTILTALDMIDYCAEGMAIVYVVRVSAYLDLLDLHVNVLSQWKLV